MSYLLSHSTHNSSQIQLIYDRSSERWEQDVVLDLVLLYSAGEPQHL